MIIIAAVDKNYGIGYQGNLLFKIPEDIQFFKETTIDNVVVMGRKTFESIGGKPLKYRTNLVISSDTSLMEREDIYCSDIDDIDDIIEAYESNRIMVKTKSGKYEYADVFIIGGAGVYNHYIDDCDMLLLTHYDKAFENVDAYFPNPSAHGFHIEETILQGTFEDRGFYITKWIRN